MCRINEQNCFSDFGILRKCITMSGCSLAIISVIPQFRKHPLMVL